ncbi:MAG: hypothetical protein AAFO96_29460, partial [Bacteroidota bacterium]
MEGRKDEFLKLSETKSFTSRKTDSQIGYLEVKFDLTEDAAKEARSLLFEGNHGNDNSTGGRGPNIVDGLETQLVHDFDFHAFRERVDELFKWHDDESLTRKYCAPYFAFIQSSGMGKTKLFAECRSRLANSEEEKCLTILCVDAKLSDDQRRQYYDDSLIFDIAVNDIVEHVQKQLDKLLPKDDKCKKLVLLFDEAQGLMKGNDIHGKGSLMFRAIRWWLRAERRIKVVASFAGTNAKLSNFYPPDPPTEGASRNVQRQYKNYIINSSDQDKKELYPPFFELHTIGCLVAPMNQLQSDNDEPGFPQASVYGRPLFAYYHNNSLLDNTKLETFAFRLVLSRSEYYNDLQSCFSVLGARVQMGIVNSFEILSVLISSGYACLVDFQQQENSGSAPVARLTFMPDPLCATLAMRYMDEGWIGLGFKGKCGKFWVEQAVQAFNSRLCLAEKGDAGEIFAALYMLLCGDVLRREKDREDEDLR